MVAPGDKGEQDASPQQVLDAEQQIADDGRGGGEDHVAGFEDAHPVEPVDERNEDGVDEDDDREIKHAAQGERAEERQAAQRNAGRAAQCDFEPGDCSPVDPADHGAGKGVVVGNTAVDRPGERAGRGNPDDRSCRRVEPHRRIIERIGGCGLPCWPSTGAIRELEYLLRLVHDALKLPDRSPGRRRSADGKVVEQARVAHGRNIPTARVRWRGCRNSGLPPRGRSE